MVIPAEIPSLSALEAEQRRRARNKIDRMFPAEGPFRRELYPKHLEFFRAGAAHRERAFIAGNRTGKTEAGAYEATLHLTGLYPDWWEGRRFAHPTKGWACSDTTRTLRDVLQQKFLGMPGEYGTGMVPGDHIIKVTTKQGLADAADTIYVKHVSGGRSVVTFKSYQEGRESFQGSNLDFCWADEECPLEIWTEMLMRTMTTNGLGWLTFTPLSGLSSLVLEFMPGGRLPEQNQPK